MKKYFWSLGSAILIMAAFFVFAESAFAISYQELLQNHNQTTGKVLGESVYETVKVFSAGNLKLYVTPLSYNSSTDKWNYRISWNRMANRTGSIYINNNFFYDNASDTGQNETGFSLDPDARYRITYYSSAGGKGVKIVNRFFKTLSAPADDTPDTEDNSPDNASNNPCKNPLVSCTVAYNLSLPNIDGQTSVMAGSINTYSAMSYSNNFSSAYTITYIFDWGDGLAKNTKTVTREIRPSFSHVWNNSGIYNITVTATDSLGKSSSSSMQVKVSDASTSSQGLHITSSFLPTGTVGVPYSATTVFSYNGTYALNGTWSGLPSGIVGQGLASNPNNFYGILPGLQNYVSLSGTPTQAGTYNVTLYMTDQYGATDSKTFVLIVNPASSSLNITPTNLPDATVGQAYSTKIYVTGGIAPYTWKVESTTYPSACCVLGLTGSGLGQPTYDNWASFNTQSSSVVLDNPGTYTWTFTIKDGSGASVTKTVTLIIRKPSAQPDFAPQLGSISPKLDSSIASNGIAVNKTAIMTFKIVNQGVAGAQLPMTQLDEIGGLKASSINNQIPENTCKDKTYFNPGESCIYAAAVTYNQTSTTTNYASFKLTVDQGNYISESDETNNWAVINFDVK